MYFNNLCRAVWIVIGGFLFEKQAFNGLLKVIGIQISFQFKQCHIRHTKSESDFHLHIGNQN